MQRSNPYLLETDQEFCYAETGRILPCTQTGQDSAHPKKAFQTVPNRLLVRDTVVKDTLTGAVWTRDANPAEFPLSWNEAHAYLANMRRQFAHGHRDWQLPPRRLLFSLISHQHINPALPPLHPFENVFPGYYWSSDTCARLPDQAWYIHLGGGRIPRGMKHGAYMVWPVCPGETVAALGEWSPGDRFTADDMSVHDALTGLTWFRNADPVARPLSWQAALETTRAINRDAPCGHGDWRLPNIRELESLVDLATHSPALPAGHPFANVREAYWSSTTSVYEPRYAWVLYSRDGMVGVGFKPGEDFFLWPVRNG